MNVREPRQDEVCEACSQETNRLAKVKLVWRRHSVLLGDGTGSPAVENFIHAGAETGCIKRALPLPTSSTKLKGTLRTEWTLSNNPEGSTNLLLVEAFYSVSLTYYLYFLIWSGVWRFMCSQKPCDCTKYAIHSCWLGEKNKLQWRCCLSEAVFGERGAAAGPF